MFHLNSNWQDVIDVVGMGAMLDEEEEEPYLKTMTYVKMYVRSLADLFCTSVPYLPLLFQGVLASDSYESLHRSHRAKDQSWLRTSHPRAQFAKLSCCQQIHSNKQGK